MAAMVLSTAFTEFYSLQHPIALAPMGGSAGGALAAAVSNGGGLGLLGGGPGDLDWLARELPIVADGTDKPWGVGFQSWAIDVGTVERALKHNPRAVMLCAGDRRRWAWRSAPGGRQSTRAAPSATRSSMNGRAEKTSSPRTPMPGGRIRMAWREAICPRCRRGPARPLISSTTCRTQPILSAPSLRRPRTRWPEREPADRTLDLALPRGPVTARAHHRTLAAAGVSRVLAPQLRRR
jgi:hypothetical protein